MLCRQFLERELLPVVVRLKTWRAQNDISQAEAVELLSRRGLPVRLRTLQAWEAGRSAP
jgi:DNA-binding transcriptional regulator YiaG